MRSEHDALALVSSTVVLAGALCVGTPVCTELALTSRWRSTHR